MAKEETKIEITDKTEEMKEELETGEDTALDESTLNGSNEPDLENEPCSESDEKSDELQDAKKEAKEAYDRFLRMSAEFDNYKKRAIREAAEFKKFANETLVKEILPIIDNLERAIESSAEDTQAKNGLVEGVGMTLKEMLRVFDKFHVKPIDSIGEPFDPCYHQAVVQEESDSHPENTVIKELQRGYMMHDRLIRPAMVIVSSAKSENGSEDGNLPEKECGLGEEKKKD
jgi:molecular chaperone GrpE